MWSIIGIATKSRADMQPVAIVLLSVSAAVLYGIVHDQITARVCVEYFTIGHVPIFGTDDPTLLGLGWGVLATWWAGLMLGIPLAVAARAGQRPPRQVTALIRPVLYLLAVMAACALTAGILGGLLAANDFVVLQRPLAQAVPADRHVVFLVDLWAHNASYLVGFSGGLVVIAQVWYSRMSQHRAGGLQLASGGR